MLAKQLATTIRSYTPNSVRHFLFRLGMFFGPPVFPDLRNSLRALKSRGFAPRQAIDIGAYHGTWTQTVYQIFPDCRFLMVEAQENKRSTLEKTVQKNPAQFELEIALLGPTDGKDITFFEMETGSSVLEENSYFPRQARVYQSKSLDSVAKSHLIKQCDILKLDVQGYELEILKGSIELLKKTNIVIVESSLVPINKNCPLVAEVIAFMDSMSFQLYDIVSQIRRPDQVLWQADLMFISRKCELLPEPKYWH